MPTPDHDRVREARRILDRAAGESTGFADRLFARAATAVWPPYSPGEDSAEVWGRRVGRTLGWIAAAGLFINLLTRWFF